MSIIFEVIDLECQQADLSFFVPAVSMTTKSTSTFATVLGYSEFGTPSLPPKKYRTITFSGSSTRVAFTAEQTPQQCGGAQFAYSGVGQIDLKGNQVSKYSKKFFAQCSKQYWPSEPVQLNDFAITTGGAFPTFVSFCWAHSPNSCPTCDPNEANWSFIGDEATNNPILDLSAFIHSPNDPVVTKTSWSVNDVFNALTSISEDSNYSSSIVGTDSDNYTIAVGALNLTGRSVVTNPSPLTFPAVAIKDSGGDFITAQYIVFADTNNYSAVLSDEYTDADAAANATTIIGTGRVAENLPRTTGFTSKTTSVVFTLTSHNLINGQNYMVSVDFVDLVTNITTTKQYPFTATGGSNIIIDTIPTPQVGHSVQIKNPRIAFA